MSAIRLSLLEWACNRYSKSPHELRKLFSYAELDFFYDAYWWANYIDPPDEQDSGSKQDPDVEYIDATKQSSDAIMDLFRQ